MLFLNTRPPLELSTVTTGPGGSRTRSTTMSSAFHFTGSYPTQSEWDYSIDTLSRDWLPAEEPDAQQQGSGTVKSQDQQEFITDGSKSPSPVISLAELKSRITKLEDRLNAGKGIPGFWRCVEREVMRERYRAQTPYEVPEESATLASDAPAGTVIDRHVKRYRDPEYDRYWLTGPVSGLFQTTTHDRDSDPSNGYDQTINTIRPLRAGVYQFQYQWQRYDSIPCNFVAEPFAAWTVTVEAPLGTVHEAFFDPVADGAAVGYTAGAGRLEPAAFDFDGTGVKITDLRWEEGSVSLTVDPPGGLTDFALEFIALDGTTSRRLSGPAATEDAGTGTITWQVSAPIWEDGDLVLLRISEGGGDPSPAPADEPTATPEPTAPPRSPTPTSASYPDPGAGNGSNAWHVTAGPSESDQKGIRSIY